MGNLVPVEMWKQLPLGSSNISAKTIKKEGNFHKQFTTIHLFFPPSFIFYYSTVLLSGPSWSTIHSVYNCHNSYLSLYFCFSDSIFLFPGPCHPTKVFITSLAILTDFVIRVFHNILNDLLGRILKSFCHSVMLKI